MKRLRPQILTVTDERGRLISARVHAVHPMPRRLQRALKALILRVAKLTRAELVELRRKRLNPPPDRASQAVSAITNRGTQRREPARLSGQPVSSARPGDAGAASH